MSLHYCDCCNAPMVNVSHHSADSCAYGDTDACVLCTSRIDDADALLEEIVELGEYITTPGVPERILVLSERVNLLDAREQRRQDERDFPAAVAADRRRGL